MPTKILRVISEYCNQYVDDYRLSELVDEAPALYARRMWGYLQTAIPRCTLPPELYAFIAGTVENPKITEPSFTSTKYVLADDETTDFDIELGSEYAGYDIASCRYITYDAAGNMVLSPVASEYDAETGAITIKTYGAEFPKGITIDIDFYKDGEFAEELPMDVMHILGLAFAVSWDERFVHDYLSDVDKVEDKSFFEQNRANKMKANDARIERDMKELAGAMRRYDQNRWYNKIVPTGRKL